MFNSPYSVPCRGILFFNAENFTDRVLGWYSVPCRGILFFNILMNTKQYTDIEIPSPVGESYFSIIHLNKSVGSLVIPSPVGESYFSIQNSEPYELGSLMIPSPVGESYFSILVGTGCVYDANDSVPCRGILFFNSSQNVFNFVFIVYSVPCRGILFFNLLLHWKKQKGRQIPSPVGESYFSI